MALSPSSSRSPQSWTFKFPILLPSANSLLNPILSFLYGLKIACYELLQGVQLQRCTLDFRSCEATAPPTSWPSILATYHLQIRRSKKLRGSLLSGTRQGLRQQREWRNSGRKMKDIYLGSLESRIPSSGPFCGYVQYTVLSQHT